MSFDLDAGVLCLDFANTAEWHASEQPAEKLRDYADLLAWAEAAGALPAERGAALRRLARRRPAEVAVVHARAIALREATYRLFASHARAEGADPADLALLNEHLGPALRRLRLDPSPAGFVWAWAEGPPDLVEPLWPVVRSAGELLTSDHLERVAQCADDRGCGYLFLDMSRNRSRRWCSMDTCGNRAKARRHYRRQKAEPPNAA